MRTAQLDYTLPEELIASSPPAARDGARLLLVDERGPREATGGVRALAELVPARALVVVNDTRVLPARLLGQKEGTGGKAEIFLVRRGERPGEWLALGRASKGLRDGARVAVGPTLVAEVAGRAEGPDGEALLRVVLSTRDGSDVDEARRRAGQVPLPPYIRRAPTADDAERYQTLFAREEGAVAAPTAGLHLSHELLSALEARGVELARVTLHVGLGTFAKVTTEDLTQHRMHAEAYTIPEATRAAIARARARGAPVVAIGTTVVRALESAPDPEREGHVLSVPAGETRMLILPGYRFRVVDTLLTNLHLPRSTLLALVCAFGGTERVLAAYELAVRARLRFFSYGDAMLVARDQPQGAR